MNRLLKWFLAVWFNTILGFLLGYNSNQEHLTGMVLGVMTWYLVYVFIDYLLIKSGKEKESRRLFISALIRIPLQLIYVIDFYAGFAAAFTLDFIGINRQGNTLTEGYLMTVFTGFYLSLVCGVIFIIVTAIGKFIESRKNLQVITD